MGETRKKKKKNIKQRKEEPDDRKDSENHTRRKNKRESGMAQSSHVRTAQSLLQQNRGAVGYISLKQGRIPRNLSSFKYK